MILGTDINRWQGNINFGKMKQAGATFVAMRCTVGDYYTDPTFVENWEKAQDAGLYVTPYFVVAPATSSGIVLSAKNHVDRLLKELGDRKEDFPLIMDCELSRGRSRDQIRKLYTDIIRLLQEKQYGPNWFPIIYTRALWWKANVSDDSWWRNGICPLHVARYSDTLTGPWSDGSCLIPGWTMWDFWQWSADGNGRGAEFGVESASIDLNWFNGDLTTFQRRFGLEVTGEPEPDPELPDTVVIKVGWMGLNARTSPDASNYSNRIAKLYNGVPVTVLDKVGQWYKVRLEQDLWIHENYTK